MKIRTKQEDNKMDEQLQILKMLEEGKITAEQASDLLSAVKTGKETAKEGFEMVPQENVDYDKRMFRVIVDSATGDKVNVQLPIAAVRSVLQVTGKIPALSDKLEGVDLAEVLDTVINCLDAQAIGDIVSVESSTGDFVKIFIG